MDQESMDKGRRMREEWLGGAHVQRSLDQSDEFSRPIQEIVTGFAWGEIWTRPGLDKRARSLCTMAVLTALGRAEELRFHVRAALRNGVTEEELREMLLHVALYAGFPATLQGVRVAQSVLREEQPG